MKYSIFLIFIFFLRIVFGQSSTKVHEFRGGNINFDLTFYTSMIYGVGSRNMNTNSTLRNYGAECIYWNPAGMAFMKNTQFFIDYAPPLSINPNAFVDFQTEINTKIDNEFKPKLSNGATYEHPVLTTDFPSGARIQSIGIAVPWKSFTIGFSYYNPFEFKLSFLESGFRAFMIDNESSAIDPQTAFRASGDINGDLHIFAESFAVGLGYRISDNFAAGLTFERYNITAKAKASFNFYGSLAIGYNGNFGEAELFNDASHGYPNSLFSKLNGRFTGDSWGIRLGTSYRLNKNSEVALSSNIPPTIHLTGNLGITENTPVFYSNGDIDVSKIDSNQTVRTEQINYRADGMDIQMPVSLDIGYSYIFRGLMLVSNVGFYFNDFSVNYSNIESNSNDTTVVKRSYKKGIKPNMDVRLGLDFGGIKIGTGIIFADEVSDGDKTSSFIIPIFSLSCGFAVAEKFHIDANLLSIAMPFSRITLSYFF